MRNLSNVYFLQFLSLLYTLGQNNFIKILRKKPNVNSNTSNIVFIICWKWVPKSRQANPVFRRFLWRFLLAYDCNQDETNLEEQSSTIYVVEPDYSFMHAAFIMVCQAMGLWQELSLI